MSGESPILVRLPEGAELDIVAIVNDEEGRTRGLAVHGGWVSIVSDGGNQYLEPVQDVKQAAWVKSLAGIYRLLQPFYPAPIFKKPSISGTKIGQIPAGSDFECSSIHFDDDNQFCQLSTGSWALLYSSEHGHIAEKVVHNWNDAATRL